MFSRRFINLLFFFFNDTATTEIYTLSLHDALPICGLGDGRSNCRSAREDGSIARDVEEMKANRKRGHRSRGAVEADSTNVIARGADAFGEPHLVAARSPDDVDAISAGVGGQPARRRRAVPDANRRVGAEARGFLIERDARTIRRDAHSRDDLARLVENGAYGVFHAVLRADLAYDRQLRSIRRPVRTDDAARQV